MLVCICSVYVKLLMFSRISRRLLLNFHKSQSFSPYKSIKRLLSEMDFKTIGTHDGSFHCDEVFGCFMLKLLNPDVVIIRTRDDEVLKDCDIVIDVGGVYEPEKKRFDHHQRSFDHSMSTIIPGKESKVKLSSAGLIYCHYGKFVLQKILGSIEDATLLETLFDKIYSGFVLEIDAIDNGLPICTGEQLYYIKTHLSARVAQLNQEWNIKDFDVTQAFHKAMDLVGKEFKECVNYYHDVWWPARKIVIDSIIKRNEVHSSGEIIELQQFCPWKTHYFDLEKELDIKPPVKYVVFPASQARTIWRTQAVPENKDSFVLRCPLNENWRGLRDNELSQVSGIQDCIFVHASGFIGGNKTRNGAIEMAIRSLSL